MGITLYGLEMSLDTGNGPGLELDKCHPECHTECHPELEKLSRPRPELNNKEFLPKLMSKDYDNPCLCVD